MIPAIVTCSNSRREICRQLAANVTARGAATLRTSALLLRAGAL
jgi:hypothetical protein